ncbi:MAG: type II toxin-antitoxin system RelE/ParE family toxin [Steroidobacteraceae bacterium]
MARSFRVLLTQDAAQDLQDIYEYIASASGLQAAVHVLEQLLAVRRQLAHFPERGSRPAELVALGIGEYRQVLSKPWRLIYRVAGKAVVIYLIADGRRDMPALLARRLLGG